MHQPSANVIPLAGMPEPAPPTPTAGDLVAAWCEGWSSTHDGNQPDPSVLRRVRGICRNVARDRTDLESWRAAWRAARSAGVKGRYDVVAELAAPRVTSAGRANHYLAIARDTGHPSAAGALVTALTPRVGGV